MSFYLEGCPVSLNIKNEETCNLARERADLTGETMTGAITIALRERLEREQREARLEAIHAIQARVERLLTDGAPPVDHADLLYDERGLPK